MIVKIKLFIPILILLLFTLSGCKKVSTDNPQDGILKEYPTPDVVVSVFQFDFKTSSFQDKEFPLSENEKAYLYHIISTSQRSSDVLKSGSAIISIICRRGKNGIIFKLTAPSTIIKKISTFLYLKSKTKK